MTLSDLAKYSVTGSIAQSVCNSWASCLIVHIGAGASLVARMWNARILFSQLAPYFNS